MWIQYIEIVKENVCSADVVVHLLLLSVCVVDCNDMMKLKHC